MNRRDRVSSETQRSRWTEYIGRRGYRLLTTSTVAAPRHPKVNPASVRRFIAGLRQGDPEYAAGLYFLFSPLLVSFMEASLPKLLRALSHGTKGRVVASRGGVRGHLRWGDTLRGRLTGKLSEGSYVVGQTFRSADIPENRLVKWVIMRVHGLLATAGGRAAASSSSEEGGELGSVRELLNRLERAAAGALRAPHMRSVQAAPVSSQMRQAARRRRGRAYKEAAILEQRLVQLLESPRAALLAFAQDRWLEPLLDEDLFELYALVRVLEELEDGLGFSQVREYSLMREGREHVAVLADKAGQRVTVYANQGMQHLVRESEYVAVLSEYVGFSKKHRQPDIVLRLQAPGIDRIVLLEMKHSAEGDYLRDGLYKVLAYLRDFKELWVGHHGRPKGILVIPEPVVSKVATTDRDAAITSADDSARLRGLIARGLALT